MARLRVLTFTSLYPSAARPRHGIFVETRLRHLTHDCPIDARVVAPVPWFPFKARLFGEYAAMAATPQADIRPGGIAVRYPRYLMVPRVGMAMQPGSMLRAARGAVRQFAREGWQPDIIDAHYLYPDGVAAADLAGELDVPLTVTARGTDANVIAQMPGPRRLVSAALRRAHAVIAVSSQLRDRVIELGVDPARAHVLRNGVDTEIFFPEDRATARTSAGLSGGPWALCVGNLLPVKGHELAIEALAHLPGWQLALVGDGPLKDSLAAQAARLGLMQRVRFIPVQRQDALRRLYSAADVLLLPSLREGWPNVVLEALACGTPVVACAVGAVRDMLTHDGLGAIVAERDAGLFAQAVRYTQDRRGDAQALHAHARSFDWTSISRAQYRLFVDAVGGKASQSVPGEACGMPVP